jgi:acyl-CoA dehydrogenase
MRWVGQCGAAFDMMCERAISRDTKGELLIEKQMIQEMIAESSADIRALRLMALHSAWLWDNLGASKARVEIAELKFWGARVLHDVIDRAIQVHGALGVTGDTPLEWMYREARYARIYDGPDEVHREVVARKLVKDPANGPWRV